MRAERFFILHLIRSSFNQATDEGVAAEHLEQHAGDADAEILNGCMEAVGEERPFAQSAYELVEQHDCQQSRHRHLTEAMSRESGTGGQQDRFQQDGRKRRGGGQYL